MRPRGRIVAAVTALAFAAVGCTGPASGSAPAAVTAQSPATATDAVRATLVEAQAAAKAYGRAHLGHYADLDVAGLEGEGLQLPAAMTVEVSGNHHGFCIIAANPAAEAAWQRGSIADTSSAPEPGDAACAG